MPPFHRLLLASALLAAPAASPALADAPRVAVDIAPVHSIVARVMQGVGEPGLVLPVGASPHGYSLRPANAALIDSADLIVWVGPELAPWMQGPVEALAPHARVMTLEEAKGVLRLPVRAGGPFEPDADGDPATQPDGTAMTDPHMWLDPDNASAFAADVAETLVELDPANQATYRGNAVAFASEMTALSAAITADLAPARGKPFIVFHDGYQYFEHRFDFLAAGSISLAEGEAPSAARVAEIRDRVKRDGVVCAFAEPQFEPKLLNTVIEGTNVRTGVLDPDGGMGLTPGPDLYPTMLLNLAKGLATCLDQ